jgi:hypothetical protein
MAYSDLLCYSPVLKRNSLLLLNPACSVKVLDDLEVRFSELVLEPATEVLLVSLVPAFAPLGLVPVIDEAVPADDQLLELVVHLDCFGCP